MDAKLRLSKKERAAIDRRIDAAYNATCSGITINMLDIPKVFKLGYEAIAAGADDARLRRQIREFVESIRVDRSPKMIPGQTPYTSAELRQVEGMISDACEAEEKIGIDELERFADGRKGCKP